MPRTVKFGKRERLSFAKLEEVAPLPDLVEVQKNSYNTFLQADVDPENREDIGLQAAFSEVFPFTDFSGDPRIEYISYKLGNPKHSVAECQERGLTYAVPLHVKVRLIVPPPSKSSSSKEIPEMKEQEVFMGDIPLMTESGTFVNNGGERVIVSQLHRSPGVSFGKVAHNSGRELLSAKITPYHGAWIEFEFDIKDLIFVKLNRRKKFLATIFLRALGWETDEELIKLFLDTKEIELGEVTDGTLLNKVLASSVFSLALGTELDELSDDDNEDEDGSTPKGLIARANTEITQEVLDKIRAANIERIEIVDAEDMSAINPLLKTIAKDSESAKFYQDSNIKDKALIDIFRKLQPGDPSNIEAVRKRFNRLFFDPMRYDLARVGRYKLNARLGKIEIYKGKSEKENLSPTDRTLRKEDVVATMKCLLEIYGGNDRIDDIDHLGNRRVRTVGELLTNQVRTGLVKVSNASREKITQKELGDSMPSDLINPKPFTASLKDFFGSSQLSQFMQQINPLDSMTHKRRLSALGPGGLRRERATFDVRDVHRSHYGRVCPIETPEGPSVGLIVSLGTYTRINPYGFLETPYRQVVNGKVTDKVDYLSATEEDGNRIASADTQIDDDGKIYGDSENNRLMVRHNSEFPQVDPEEVDYVDVSPKQIVGVSAALIPFLEHDDANRALMGSNMQRQAVPLISPEAPLIGTGMEYKAAYDSSAVVIAKHSGIVERVSASELIVRTDDTFLVEAGEQSASEMGRDLYNLQLFKRSNSATCAHQRPCVKVGEKVEKGDIIADGTSTDQGELALGRNMLIAFMPWEGYNFEDAILLSERLVQDDIFTSIHIDEFTVEARESKSGKEEITRDIPHLSKEAQSQLDDEGVIRVGATISPGSVLVGKVTPKGDSDIGPQEKLLRAIFGDKVGEYRDVSTYAKPGVEGVVIDVKVFARKGKDKTPEAEQREQAKIKRIEREAVTKSSRIKEQRDREIRRVLLHGIDGKSSGQLLVSDVNDGRELLAKRGTAVTETLLNSGLPLHVFEVENPEIKAYCDRVRGLASKRIAAYLDERTRKIEKIKKGDELKPGVTKLVKVYVAIRRKISVGDKMAGRHGNKGVVAKIMPVEDMPYLEDGTPIEVVLNPLGVPSRMNVGQVLETHLGWAVKKLGIHIATPVFNGATEEEIQEQLIKAHLPPHGKTKLYDGRTGMPFHQEVTVGYAYLMKLNHLVDNKLHARSTGPYSLVTQQPLGGKAQQGGQRLGEMEVWALEAYGAAHILQELLTVKSDDVVGRSEVYEAIVKGKNVPPPGLPESFNVLLKELQGLCLNVNLRKQ